MHVHIALLCVQENAIDRPSMLEVSSLLKNETVVVKIPKCLHFQQKEMQMTKTTPDCN